MARCMAFPPPWYVFNGVTGEALLELIKVRREKAADEKRRKKEKRRRKKEEEQKCRHKHKRTKKCGDSTGDCQMNRENENQLFDKSSLTEELDEQLMILDSLYDSSDNTDNIKGKEHGCSTNGCSKHGSIIQVGLQTKEHKYSQVLSSKVTGCCSTRTDLSVQEKFEVASSSIEENAETASTSIFSGSCLLHAESKYKELILNWEPPPIQI